MKALNREAKMTIAADFEGGRLIRAQFPFPWSEVHFSRDGNLYSIKPKFLTGEKTTSYNLLVRWGEELAEVSKKIGCASII